MTNKPDSRRWRIISDYLGNDPEPYTTQQLFDYVAACNAEHANDPEWGPPFMLHDAGDKILDLSHQNGNDGYIAAVEFVVPAEEGTRMQLTKYKLAHMLDDGSWDVFETFEAEDDFAANAYAVTEHPTDDEWYILGPDGRNINGGTPEPGR